MTPDEAFARTPGPPSSDHHGQDVASAQIARSVVTMGRIAKRQSARITAVILSPFWISPGGERFCVGDMSLTWGSGRGSELKSAATRR